MDLGAAQADINILRLSCYIHTKKDPMRFKDVLSGFSHRLHVFEILKREAHTRVHPRTQTHTHTHHVHYSCGSHTHMHPMQAQG